MIPNGMHWRGPNWMAVRRGQWLRRGVFGALERLGLVTRSPALEDFGHGFRVYRLTADTGHLHADNL